MEQRQLKSLVENGGYRPQPELVAAAMLRRRGVCAFLTGAPLSPAGRIQSPPEAPRRAA
jgi:hypothetical protein